MRCFPLWACGVLLALPTTSDADHCNPLDFSGKTIYRHTALTPIDRTAWYGPSSLGIPGGGATFNVATLYSRDVAYRLGQSDHTVHSCYLTRWDRFWAVRGLDTQDTTVPGPGQGTTVRRTTYQVIYFGGPAPPDDLPHIYSEFTIHDPPDPSSCVQIAFSEAGSALLDLPTLSPPDSTHAFSYVLTVIGSRFLAAAPFMGTLYNQSHDLESHPGLTDFQTEFQQVYFAMQSIGQSLQFGVPPSSSDFMNLSDGLRALAASFETYGEDPSLKQRVAFLRTAADEMAEAAAQVAPMYAENTAGWEARGKFLERLLRLGTHLRNFAEGVTPVPFLGGPAIVTLVIGLLVVGTFGARRAARG